MTRFFIYIGLSFLMGFTAEAQFVDRALEYGIVHNFNGLGFGSGVSLVDINGDGRDDLTLGTGPGTSLVIYLQVDTGFVMLEEVSLSEITQTIRGVNWVDYDNDGDKDLFVTYWDYFSGGGLGLYNQDEFGHFVNVTWSAGLIPANASYYGSTWGDYDSDGFLDLYICNYSTGTFGRNPFYHNNGDGTFTEMSMSLGVDDTQGYSFNSVFFDADLDGDLDLFTSNDRGAENRLYQNLDNQALQDVSAATNMHAILNAMGVELGDFDNDLDFDIYVTNTTGTFQGNVGNALFRNDGTSFEWLQGNPVEHSVGTFWGCNFIDFDYDRDLDLFIVNSQRIFDGYSRYFYINDGTGEFSDYPGDEFHISNGNHYASAQGDLNSDGYLDLVVSDGSTGASQIWTGPPTNNHWVKVHLEGTISNRDGIGALIEVWADGVKRIDQTTCTSSHLAQDSNNYPFGLGPYPQADTIIIRWPSGIVNKVYDVPCELRIHVVEDADQETVDCLPQVDWNPLVIEGLSQMFSFTSEETLTDIQWSINNEVLGISDTLSIEFTELGTYELCLLVSNSCSSQEWCETIAIGCTTPEPEAIWSQDLLNLTLDVSMTYDSIFWDLGDGTFLTGDSLQYTYEEAGIYTLCVTVFDQCGSDSLCWDIEVTCQTPMADFSYELNGSELEGTSLAENNDSLFWTWNGTYLSNEASVSFMAEFGINELCLFAFNTCGVDSFCATLDINPVGLEEISSQNTLTLYPNPAKEDLVISWDAMDEDPVTLTVFDMNGRKISIRTKAERQNGHYLSLDISNLDVGFYLLEVQWPSGFIQRHPFAKE